MTSGRGVAPTSPSSIRKPDFGGQQFTREELQNSRPFDERRLLIGAGGEALLARSLAALLANEPTRTRTRKTKDHESLKAALSALLANLLAAKRSQRRPDAFVGVSFDAAYYAGRKLSLTGMQDVRNFLLEAGLAVGQGGYQRIGASERDGSSHRTRLRATEALSSWFIDAGIDLTVPSRDPESGLGWSNDVPPVVMGELQSDAGPEPAEVIASRQVVIAANRLIAEAAIELPPEAWDRIDRRGRPDPDADEDQDVWETFGDPRRHALYRKFKRRWEEGGRLYGGWWQTLPKRERAVLTIDGAATVELDYGRLHPTLAWAREGLELTFDPYQVPGQPESLREVGKRTWNRLINRSATVDPSRISPDVRDRPLLPPGFDFKVYAAALVDLHRPIAHLFGSGIGVQLQRQDSDILVEVLKTTTAAGIVALPIHDSLIVTQPNEAKLLEAMRGAYGAVAGLPPGRISRA